MICYIRVFGWTSLNNLVQDEGEGHLEQLQQAMQEIKNLQTQLQQEKEHVAQFKVFIEENSFQSVNLWPRF